MKLEKVVLDVPEGTNLIFGQSHFIKTVEDIYEALAASFAGIKFGLAFCEASGKCLVRVDGTDEEMKKTAAANAARLGCGHSFLVYLKDAFPINVLPAVKAVPEVCSIYCATGNPVEVIVAETGQGRGVMGVIDGSPPQGVEGDDDVRCRKELLRKLGYKR